MFSAGSPCPANNTGSYLKSLGIVRISGELSDEVMEFLLELLLLVDPPSSPSFVSDTVIADVTVNY